MIPRLDGVPAWVVLIVTQSVNEGPSITTMTDVYAVAPTHELARDIVNDMASDIPSDAIGGYIVEAPLVVR
jgi:hypothetical protein